MGGLQIRRGMKNNLPQLDDGELGFCKDTKELFIGNNNNENVNLSDANNIKMPNGDSVSSQLEAITNIEKNGLFIQNITSKNYYDEISKSNYYITVIPKIDMQGEKIVPRIGLANDKFNGGVENARDFYYRKNASCVINSCIFNTDTNNIVGTFVMNGTIIQENLAIENDILAFNDNGDFESFKPGTSARDILNLGFSNALVGFKTLIKNGEITHTSEGEGHPRQVFCIDKNGDYLILTVDGRTHKDNGMTYGDINRILIENNVDFAYNLDGGGSVSTILNGVKINKNIDGNNYKERNLPCFLYFKKETDNKKVEDLSIIHKTIGELDQQIKKVSLDLRHVHDIFDGYLNFHGNGVSGRSINAFDGDKKFSALNFRTDMLMYYDTINNRTMFEVKQDGQITTPKGKIGMFNTTPKTIQIADIDNISESGLYWVANATSIGGKNISYLLLNTFINTTNKMQVAFPFDETEGVNARTRRTKSGSSNWNNWRDL